MRLAFPRITATWPQAHIAADIPALLEPVLIFDGEYECQSDPRPDSSDLLQECRFRIILPGDLLDFTSLSWIFSVSDSTSFSNGSSTRRSFGGSDTVCRTPLWSASHWGNRSPIDFARPRAVFTRLVRTPIRATRTRMILKALVPYRCGAESAATTADQCAPVAPRLEHPVDRLFGCSP